MNIQRYLLPVSTAAAIHAALFFGLASKQVPPFAAEPPGTKMAEPPKIAADRLVLPPEADDTEAPIRPLAGGPTPPDLDPAEATPLPAEWTAPTPVRVQDRVEKLKVIPRVSGPGDLTGTAVGPDGTNPIFTIGALDRAPAARMQMPPDYPHELKVAGISGEVIVEFDVDRGGAVVRAHAVRSSHREFEAPAVRAVLKWRFEPGRHKGQAVPFRMTVPIEFAID